MDYMNSLKNKISNDVEINSEEFYNKIISISDSIKDLLNDFEENPI